MVGAASGVLLNDSPQDGHLSAALVAQPASGQVQLATDGSFTYTPNVGFVGVDTFTYTATDTRRIRGLPGGTGDDHGHRSDAPPPSLPANRSQFVPVAPTRIVDTRSGLGAATGPVGAGSNTVITAVGKAGIPAGATGVVVNITAADGAAGGYLQAFPTGTGVAGATSNVNIDHSNATVADLALVGLTPPVGPPSSRSTHAVRGRRVRLLRPSGYGWSGTARAPGPCPRAPHAIGRGSRGTGGRWWECRVERDRNNSG